MKKLTKVIIFSIIIIIIILGVRGDVFCRKDNLNKVYNEYENKKINKKDLIENYSSYSISEIEDRIDEIMEILDRIEGQEDLELGIELLNSNSSKYESLQKKTRLRIYAKYRNLYTLNNEYANAIEYATKCMLLSEKIGDNRILVNTTIELGVLFKKLEGYETAIELLNTALNMNLYEESFEGDSKVYALITIAGLYLDTEAYEDLKETLDKIEGYKGYFNEEDYRDVEIIQCNLYSEFYINYGDLPRAKEYLDKSLKLLEEDKTSFYYGKDIYYRRALAKYYEGIGNKKKAKEIYLGLIERAEETGDNALIEKSIRSIITIEDDLTKLVGYSKYLDKVVIYNNIKNYEEYANKILENIVYQYKIEKRNEIIATIYNVILIIVIIIIVFYRKIFRFLKRYKSDVLIDAYNRRIFDKTYKSYLKLNKDFYILMIDIDDFKKINDVYGHKYGDLVLIEVSDAVKSMLSRKSKLYRYGGEELVVISKLKEEGEVLVLAENIRSKVENLEFSNNLRVTISIGVSDSRKKKSNALEEADKNLYFSKNTGKNKVTFNISN